MPTIRALVAALFLATLIACAPVKPDEEAVAEAQAIYADLVVGGYEKVLARSTTLRDYPDICAMLEQMHANIPEGQSEPARLVGFANTFHPGKHDLGMTHLYRYPARTLGFTANFSRKSETSKRDLVGIFIIDPSPQQLAGATLGTGVVPPVKQPQAAPRQ